MISLLHNDKIQNCKLNEGDFISSLCICPFCQNNIIEISNLLISKDELDAYIEYKCSLCLKKNVMPTGYKSRNSLKEYIDFLDSCPLSESFPSCFSHSNRMGVILCKECNKYMCCLNCYKYHQKFEKKHQLYFALNVGELKCDVHREENCGFYCKECATYLCVLCNEKEKHKGHHIDTLEQLWKYVYDSINAKNINEINYYMNEQSKLIDNFVVAQLKSIDNLIKHLEYIKKNFEEKYIKIKNANIEMFKLYQNIQNNFLLSRNTPKIALINNMEKMKIDLNIMYKNNNIISQMNNIINEVNSHINSYQIVLNNILKNLFVFSVKLCESKEKNDVYLNIRQSLVDKAQITQKIKEKIKIPTNIVKPEQISLNANEHLLKLKNNQKPNDKNQFTLSQEKKIKLIETSSTGISSSMLIGHKIERSNSEESTLFKEIYNCSEEDNLLSNSSNLTNNENCMNKSPKDFYSNLNSNRNNNKAHLKRKKFKVNVYGTQEQKYRYSSCLNEIIIENYTPLTVSFISIGDNSYIAISNENKTLIFYNLNTFKFDKTITTSPSSVILLSPTIIENKEIVVALNNNTLKIINFGEGKFNQNEYIGHNKKITNIIILSDGIRFLTSSMDETIKLWNKESKEYLHNYTGHTGSITAMILFDDNIFITASIDRIIKGWGVKEKKCLFNMKGHTEGVLSLSRGPKFNKSSCNLIISISLDNTAKVWNIDDKKCIATINEDSIGLMSVLWAEPKVIVLGKNNGDMQFIDGDTFKRYQTSEIAHANGIKNLFLNSKEKTIISYSDDNKIKIWK